MSDSEILNHAGGSAAAAWRNHLLPLLVFALLASLFLGDVLLWPNSFSAFDIILRQAVWRDEVGFVPVHNLILSDSPTAHYPQRQLMIDMLRQGQVMGLNPYIFSGSVVNALDTGELLTGLPMLLLPLADALDWSTWLRMILAAFFMYLLLVDMSLRRGAATAGGVIWAFCLHQIVWLEFPQHLATQLWMPLILMLNLRLLRNVFCWQNAFALWLVNILFLTSGYLQIALYFYVLIVLFNTVYLLIDRVWRPAERVRKWLLAHGIFVLAVLCLCPLILLSGSLIEASVRGLQDSRTGLDGLNLSPSVVGESLLALLPSIDELKRYYSAPYLGGLWYGFGGQKYDSSLFGNLVEGGTYIGILPLFFAILAFVTRGRPLRFALYLALVVPLFFFWGLLQQNPLVVLIVNRIPLFGLGSYGRAITIISLLAAILAAVGIHYVQDLLHRSRLLVPSIVMAIFLALPFIANFVEPSLQLSAFAYPLGILILATGLLFLRQRFHFRLNYAHIVVLVVALDLFIVGYDFNTRMPNEKIFPATNTIKSLADDPEPMRVAVITEKPVYQPNLLMYYKIPVLGGYSTVADKEYVWFMRHFYRNAHATANGILRLGLGNMAVLRSVGAKFVITDSDVDESLLERIKENNTYSLYKIKNHLPRVYCASHSYVWARQSDRQGRFARALAENDRPVFFAQSPGVEGALTENCKVSAINAYTNGVSYEVTSDKETLVFMPYKFYERGWNVELNGQSIGNSARENIRPLRANYAFTAIKIPAGSHSVSMVYSNPATTALAIMLIIIGVVTLSAAVFMSSARRNKYLPAAITALVAVVLIGHGLFAIPGVRNDQIPERPLCDQLSGNEGC